MFKNHEARGDYCCPVYERDREIQEDCNYLRDCRNKHSKGASKRYGQIVYSNVDNGHDSDPFSDFDETPDKHTNKRRQLRKRKETSTEISRGRPKTSFAARKTEKFNKPTGCKTEKSNRISIIKECTCPIFSTLRSPKNHLKSDNPKKKSIGPKHQSKSSDTKFYSTTSKSCHECIPEQRLKFEKSLKPNEKRQKTERRWSRRDNKNTDGVTEVTSLEIVKSWSQEDVQSTGTKRKTKNLINQCRPTRRSTKVIYSRYSQESINSDPSQESKSIEDYESRGEETCSYDDDDGENFNKNYRIDDFSSDCANYIDRTYANNSRPSSNRNLTKKHKNYCDCYNDRLIDFNNLIKRNSDSESSRLRSTEKFNNNIIGLNNKYPVQKYKLTKVDSSRNRFRITHDCDKQAELPKEKYKNREKKSKKKDEKTKTKRIVSMLTTRNISCENGEAIVGQQPKMCKFVNTPEAKNMMSCCCDSSQHEEDFECSRDCCCPETLFANLKENVQSPSRKMNYNSQEQREIIKHREEETGRVRKVKNCRLDTSVIAINDFTKLCNESILSRSSYCEENYADECDPERSDETLTGRTYLKDLGQPCKNSFAPGINDELMICLCPREGSKMKNTANSETAKTFGCNEILKLKDLCPDVPPAEHWKDVHLGRVTEEYRTLTARLRDMQSDAQKLEVSGHVRKRISRKYPSGKEFSFEVKTVKKNHPEHGLLTLNENCHDKFHRVKDPLDDTSETCPESSQRQNYSSTKDYNRLRKTVPDRSICPVNRKKMEPCECSQGKTLGEGKNFDRAKFRIAEIPEI